ncbi:MAG: hypothetical protein ABSE76_01765 [Minisyncoccia bacterium]|jgi:hypothetical protein
MKSRRPSEQRLCANLLSQFFRTERVTTFPKFFIEVCRFAYDSFKSEFKKLHRSCDHHEMSNWCTGQNTKTTELVERTFGLKLILVLQAARMSNKFINRAKINSMPVKGHCKGHKRHTCA